MGYLVADGVNDYCTIPSTLIGNAGTDAYTVEFNAAFPTAPAADRFLIGVGSGTSNNGFQITTGGRLQVWAGGTNRYFTATGFIIFDSTFRTYRLEHDAGGAWRAYRNGTLFGSGTFSTSAAFTALGLFFRIHPTSSGYLGGKFSYITTTGLGSSDSWQADLSGGTGSVWPTVSGTNNATLINFPTDNSQWQGFGSSYTLTADGATFSYSGGVASTLFNRALQSDGGSFTYSGGVAATVFNRAMQADGESFAYSGGQSSLLYGRALLASGGSFSYSGGVATLVYTPVTGYVLVADGGLFSYGGGETALSFNQNYPTANPNDYIVSAYLSTDSTYTARLSESSTINAIISTETTHAARLN